MGKIGGLKICVDCIMYIYLFDYGVLIKVMCKLYVSNQLKKNMSVKRLL